MDQERERTLSRLRSFREVISQPITYPLMDGGTKGKDVLLKCFPAVFPVEATGKLRPEDSTIQDGCQGAAVFRPPPASVNR